MEKELNLAAFGVTSVCEEQVERDVVCMMKAKAMGVPENFVQYMKLSIEEIEAIKQEYCDNLRMQSSSNHDELNKMIGIFDMVLECKKSEENLQAQEERQLSLGNIVDAICSQEALTQVEELKSEKEIQSSFKIPRRTIIKPTEKSLNQPNPKPKPKPKREPHKNDSPEALVMPLEQIGQINQSANDSQIGKRKSHGKEMKKPLNGKSKAKSTQSACPICFNLFPINEVESHKNRCLGHSEHGAVFYGSNLSSENEGDENEGDKNEGDKNDLRVKRLKMNNGGLLSQGTQLEQSNTNLDFTSTILHEEQNASSDGSFEAEVANSILDQDSEVEDWDEMIRDADDGNQEKYKARLGAYESKIEGQRKELHETSIEIHEGFSLPQHVHESLYDYQRACVEWLYSLHNQDIGGIVGDEMGLGKTIQVAAFLAGLHHSGLFQPSIVVCPASVLRQWSNELRRWYPPFYVLLLHETGTLVSMGKSKEEVIHTIAESGDILITTYEGLRNNKEIILSHSWGYIILDEGHKIRNPDAEITLVAKQIDTPHRLILTGTPIQNNLKELWSLFDFIHPGHLGTLPVFEKEFSIPIRMGGYVNASKDDANIAYQCALLLRQLISPYLLRRTKKDIENRLPPKTEQVLFCRLQPNQSDLYAKMVRSELVNKAIHENGAAGTVYRAIDLLRKVCNHPDLLLRQSNDKPSDYGNWERSGKLCVVREVLRLWKEQDHRVLLFSQTRQMLDIIEQGIRQDNYRYCRMDGSTSVKLRQSIISNFNSDASIYVFLLTTRAGGLGINLIGADRVILFDPDWNPTTDMQARARAWRFGQSRPVTIYRLITSGTIEEKVYHRQIFKQYLTNKILVDPKQRRFFKKKDLRDLFSFHSYAEGSEIGKYFSEHEIINANLPERAKPKHSGLAPLQNPERVLKSGVKENTETVRNDPSIQDDIPQGPDNPSLVRVEQHETTEDDSKTHNNSVLEVLFNARTLGVQSAFTHDIVEETGTSESRELSILASEASRKVQKAIQELQRSVGQIYSEGSITTPTWTGRSGTAGAPKPKFGRVQATTKEGTQSQESSLSSGSMLSNMRNESNGTEASVDLARSLVTFLSRRGGSADSDSIVKAFSARIDCEFTFREILRSVAEFRQQKWCLRQEFGGL